MRCSCFTIEAMVNALTISSTMMLGAVLGAALVALARLLVNGAEVNGRQVAAGAAITAVLTAVLAAQIGSASHLWLSVVFVSVLLAAVFTDLNRRLIPNRLTLAGLTLILLLTAIIEPAFLTERASFAIASFTFFAAAALLRPGGLGFGDVKLAAVIGAAMGAGSIVAFLVAFVAAAFFSVGITARSGWRHARGATIPLAPFLAAGAIAVLLLAG